MEEEEEERGKRVPASSVSDLPEGEAVGDTLIAEGGTPRLSLGGTGGSGSVNAEPLSLLSPRLCLWTGAEVARSGVSPEFKPSRTVKHRDS